MTSKQRAYLRGLANTLQPIFQIGKSGLSDNLIKQLDDALEARELIKISVLETAPSDVKSLGEEIANSTNSVCVQTVGSKITLYRAKKKDSKIKLAVENKATLRITIQPTYVGCIPYSFIKSLTKN